jgi:hypothetical protein
MVMGSGAASGTSANASSASSASTSAVQPQNLDIGSRSLLDTLQTDSGLLDNLHTCDIPELPLQRWVNISIAVNGKTVDVYIDGKLSRSCVLSAPFRVDEGYNATVLEYGGFGGQIANTIMYDTALNPEEVYKNYMAGPEPITTFGGLLSNYFAPNIRISIS